MIRFRPRHALFGLLLLVGMAHAAGIPRVHDAWIRLLPAGLPAGGYFTLTNTGDAGLRLVAAESSRYRKVMLHRSLTQDGRSGMSAVDHVDIAPGATLRFAPGGYHLMLMQARKPVTAGERVPVTLIFADGMRLTVEFRAQPADALGP